MAQYSRPQAEDVTVNPAYTDSGPYTDAQWAQLLELISTLGQAAARGVIPTYLNQMVVSTDGSAITIATGAALVTGHILINDAAVTITPSAPGAPATYTAVGVENRTAAAYNALLDTPAPYAGGVPAHTARLAIFQGGLGALVQSATIWMTPLATFSIDAGGNITALVDVRDPIRAPWMNVSDSIQIDFGGNARGASAVDLQRTRSLVTEVASGNYSFVAGGGQNTASGLYSHAEGYIATASGAASHAEGSGATASNASAHAEGTSTTASGPRAHAEGNQTVASGDNAHAEGDVTTASGTNAHAEGRSTLASGNNSHAEGNETVASGTRSHASGYRAVARMISQVANASGYFAAVGDAQGTLQLTARATTAGGGAATELFLDGATATERMVILEGEAWTYDILVVAIRQNVAAIHSTRAYGVIYRAGAGNATLASASGVIVEQAGGGTTTVAADAVNQSLLVSFTDDGANAYRAVATVRLAQVSWPA